jgi:hypothetical protein
LFVDRDLMWPLYLACGTYLATLSLGASVQYAHVRLGRWRSGHHILFFCTWLTTGLAIGLGWWWEASWWWLPLLLLPVLALFPRRRAATRAHRVLALAGLAIWAGILGLGLG